MKGSGARYEFTSNLKAVTATQKLVRANALRTIGNVWLAKSTLLTPVDTGNLRASLQTTSDDDKVRLGSNVEYAPPVHENLHAYHKVGQAKFIEAPLKENAEQWVGYVASQLAKTT